jgi:hypothetical protein
MISEWGRQGHSLVRYGIVGATDVDHEPQTEEILQSLDAASAAGVYVLVGIGDGVDTLAHARLGIPNKKTGLVDNATELWEYIKGNVSLVKGHPAVAAFYGCDDCCHMNIIKEHGMGEMQAIAQIKRDIFDIDPHHLM